MQRGLLQPKRIVQAVALSALCLVRPGSAAGPEAVPGPRIQFAETNFNFGTLESGQLVRHDYVFTNIGNQTLEILDVQPSCGCTTIPNWNRTIPAGGVGSIPFQFDSEGFSGEVSKTVVVLSNDPMNTNVVLRFHGTAWRTIEITPTLALFSPSSDNVTNDRRKLRIVNNRKEPLFLWKPECAVPAFELELRTNNLGKEYELSVVLNNSSKLISTNSQITLQASLAKSPVMSVPVRLMIRPAVSVLPERITLPAAPTVSIYKHDISIRNQGTNAVLVLSDPRVNLDGVQVSIRQVQPGRLFTMSLVFPAGVRLQPGQTVEARVKTNHPLFPELKIPVFQGQSLAGALEGPDASNRENHGGTGGSVPHGS